LIRITDCTLKAKECLFSLYFSKDLNPSIKKT
jgi:hypothetical protein